MTMSGVVKALQRHWMLASSLGLVVAVASAAAAWYFLPPAKYTARVLLRVHSTPQSVMFEKVHAPTDFSSYQRTQIALVKSRDVLTTALSKDQVSELSIIKALREKRGFDEVVNWLERELQVDFSVGPEILRIALNGDQPEELKTIVTEVQNAYLSSIDKKEHEAEEAQLEYIRNLKKRFDKDVSDKRKLIEEKSKKEGTSDPTARAFIRKLDQEYFNRTKLELIEVRSDLRKLLLEREAVSPSPGAGSAFNSQAAKVTVNDRTLDEFLKNDPEGKRILERKHTIEVQVHEASSVLSDDKHPIMRRFKQDLEGAQAQLEKLRSEIRPQLANELLEKGKLEKETNLAQLDKKIDYLRKYEAKLSSDVAMDEKNKEENGITSLQIESLRANLLQAEELAKAAANRLQTLEVERLAPKRISNLEPAYASHPDEQKRRLVAAGVAGGGSLALVLFVIAWWELRRQRVNSVDEVIRGLGMKLMGTVPALPSRRQLRLGSNGQADIRWQSILTESVDTARTMLLHKAASESLKMVMVTSAVGGEGKTSLSSHLAASLARAGKKTLLLDADLRNPSIHRLFGMDRTPGLCELLRGDVDLADTIQQTPAPGLSLIPAGLCDDFALQGLAQDNLRKICEPLKAEFDFIVVDSAPVLPVADSLLIGQLVDGVIFSILYNVSRFPKVYAAHQRLEMLGIRMLGAVVSGAKVDDYGPDYQYGPRAHRETVNSRGLGTNDA
jgi:polysaccharide biosynthesis transport protein